MKAKFVTHLKALAALPGLEAKRRCLSSAPDWFIRDLVLLAESCQELSLGKAGAGVSALALTRRKPVRQMRSTAIQHGGILPIFALLAPLLLKAAAVGAVSAGTGYLVKKALPK